MNKIVYEIVPNNTLNAKENTFFHKSFQGGFGIAMRLKKRNKQRDGHISYFSSGPMTSFFKSERFAKFI